MQDAAARSSFGALGARGSHAEWPSWLRGHGWDQGADGLRAPNPASPRRRTRVECDSGAGNPQQSSRAQGSRGSPAQLRPMESGGPVSKTDSGAFLSGGALGLWFAARGEFPFAGCSSKKLVLGRRCEGTSALSGRAGSGGMAGPRAQKAFVRPVLLAHEGEPVGSGFRAPETPSKAAGPREPGAAQPRIALGRAQGRGENGLRCFPEPRRLGVLVCCPRRVSLCRMQLPEARFGP